jgi:hypothetical protein
LLGSLPLVAHARLSSDAGSTEPFASHRMGLPIAVVRTGYLICSSYVL